MLDLLNRKFGRMVTGTFRSNVWDPVLIIGQIICMQCQFTVSLGLWVYILNFILGYDTEISQLFRQAVSIFFHLIIKCVCFSFTSTLFLRIIYTLHLHDFFTEAFELFHS